MLRFLKSFFKRTHEPEAAPAAPYKVEAPAAVPEPAPLAPVEVAQQSEVSTEPRTRKAPAKKPAAEPQAKKPNAAKPSAPKTTQTKKTAK